MSGFNKARSSRFPGPGSYEVSQPFAKNKLMASIAEPGAYYVFNGGVLKRVTSNSPEMQTKTQRLNYPSTNSPGPNLYSPQSEF